MNPDYKIDRLLETFITDSKEVLKENLLGIYLHGSAVMDCFNPDKSDVDLIVVVRDAVPNAKKRAFMDRLVRLNADAPEKGIEMSIVKADVCSPFVYPTPFELHFSVGHLEWFRERPEEYIEKMNGTDKDLAAHFTIIRARGRCLYGVPIGDLFGEVPKKEYLDSIWYNVENAREEIGDNPMYLILNLARVLAFAKEDLVLSKKEGGQWAFENLPGIYRPLVLEALREYTESAQGNYDPVLSEQYAVYMLDKIRFFTE